MTRYLVPPARFSNAVLIVLAGAVAAVISWAAGLLAVTLVGLFSAANLFVALRLFAYRKPVYTVTASLFAVAASFGILATPVLALYLAGARYGGLRVLIGFLIPLVLVAGLVVLGQEYLPDTGTAEFNRAVDSILYMAAVFTVATLGLLGLALVLPALDVGGLAAAVIGLLVDVVTATHLSQLGGLIVLVAAVVYLFVRVARLPLVRRAGRWLSARLEADGDDGPSLRTARHVSRAFDERATLVRHLAEGLGFVGVFAVVAGALDPALSAPLGRVAGRFPLRAVFADAAPTHLALVWVTVVLVGVGLIHRIVWWLVHIDWQRYQMRATQLAGPVLLLLAVVGASGAAVDLLIRTTALHYVVPPDAGIVVIMTEEAIRLEAFSPQLANVGLQRSSAAFVPAVRSLTGQLGAPFVLIAPLALVFDTLLLGILIAWLVLAIGWVFLFGSFELASDARIGIGLLFVGTVAAATLRISPRYPLIGVALTLLAWDLHRLTTGLRLQLDPGAATLRGELVHLGTNVVVLVGVVGLTLVGQRAMGVVPTPTASWQGLAVLVFALVAAISSLAALSLAGD